ncbi:uncharacterized protein FIBRA_02366 [Fibroporia radiculosa]|uniref:Methyltransferase small domain-containing protein n=1 Tax=Fibroporia radiculosa TaxID=599839 RepID=J4I908_9APHY|nr:uncharacterized protein FIBRA_02366 [Fibroporia radiculosa]CCM00336.1 predicted protein [Fibroporia radiculosa]
MIPTPDLTHLNRGDYLHVYEPAEDTFILLDALEQDAEELRALAPLISLEIGFIGQILGSSGTLCITTDINPHACRCTQRTGIKNKIPIDPILASLSTPFYRRLQHAVDILTFNPPYVPTVFDEMEAAQVTAGITGSWAGGTDGMDITNVFLKQVEHLLSPTGRLYLVAVKENDVPGICERMRQEYGLQSTVVLHRRAGREHLFVVRFCR